MPRITLWIDPSAAEHLKTRANASRRRPQDEAAVILEKELSGAERCSTPSEEQQEATCDER